MVVSFHFPQKLCSRRTHHVDLLDYRLSGRDGDNLRRAEVAPLVAAGNHAALLDQPSDPHLRADGIDGYQWVYEQGAWRPVGWRQLVAHLSGHAAA